MPAYFSSIGKVVIQNQCDQIGQLFQACGNNFLPKLPTFLENL